MNTLTIRAKVKNIGKIIFFVINTKKNIKIKIKIKKIKNLK
jgi:hypothetical protein